LEKGSALVKGKRKNRNLFDSFFTFGMECFSFMMLKTWLTDINAQPKVFQRQLYQQMQNPPFDFSLDLYLILTAKKAHLNTKTIPVYFGKRVHGEAKGGGSLKTKFKLIQRTIHFILKTAQK